MKARRKAGWGGLWGELAEEFSKGDGSFMVLRGRALRRLSVRSRPEARLSSIRSGGPVGEVFEEGEAGLDFLAGEVG